MKEDYKNKVIEENNELKAKVFKLETLNNEFIEKNKELMKILIQRDKELESAININRKILDENKILLKKNKELNKEQRKFIKSIKKNLGKYR